MDFANLREGPEDISPTLLYSEFSNDSENLKTNLKIFKFTQLHQSFWQMSF